MSANRSILITGSSSGIGYDAARTLLHRGWRVFATCRKPEDCQRLGAEGLESFPLDLSDDASIEAAFSEVLDRTGGRIDALFNNGAYMQVGALEDVPTDAIRALFEVNLFGCHTLTRLAIPAMRGQGHGRIVQNSSILGFVALAWRGAYTATKYALEGMTDALRLELAGSGVHVSLVQPGPIKTRIRVNSRPHFDKWIDWQNSHLRSFYESQLIPRLFDDEITKDRFELMPEAVTRCVIHALESPRPRTHYPVTVPTIAMRGFKRFLPVRMVDSILRKY
ncbi:MAG: SDR family NAD(P)-dependent oxidoreductase [Rhodobacteraceae bacterium]|nr:SDR family NAD(P)-dependent oxidoreductase [Paracoccaceae bacterium]